MKKQERDQLARDFANRLTNTKEDFLSCRDVRHSWEPGGFVLVDRAKESISKKDEYYRISECSRCGTKKMEYFTFTKSYGLDKIATSYSYPDGYLMPGYGQLTDKSRYVRTEVFHRYMEK